MSIVFPNFFYIFFTCSFSTQYIPVLLIFTTKYDPSLTGMLSTFSLSDFIFLNVLISLCHFLWFDKLMYYLTDRTQKKKLESVSFNYMALNTPYTLLTALILNGEGGIRTLAPLLTTYSLSRGAPSASLGTSPLVKPMIIILSYIQLCQAFF